MTTRTIADAVKDESEMESVASRRVANNLRKMILDGTLQPGQRIRQEELAAQFGASRLPVRDALRILESDGLVTLVANTGAWVARLDLDECIEVYRIRERIEPLALTDSIERLTAADLARLEEIVGEIERNRDIEVFLKLDRELHLLTYCRSTKHTLGSMVERFWNTTQHYRRAYATLVGSDRRWIIDYEHRLLLEAIRRADAEEAERVLIGHIRRTRMELEGHHEIFKKESKGV